MSTCVSDLAFLLGPLEDPFLDGTLTDEAIDGDLLGLTQPVSSVHGLLVHCGVPVAVIEDNLEGKKDLNFTFLQQRTTEDAEVTLGQALNPALLLVFNVCVDSTDMMQTLPSLSFLRLITGMRYLE